MTYRERGKEWLSRRFARRNRADRLLRFLERDVWPLIPPEELGKPISRAEREEILGYDPDGV